MTSNAESFKQLLRKKSTIVVLVVLFIVFPAVLLSIKMVRFYEDSLVYGGVYEGLKQADILYKFSTPLRVAKPGATDPANGGPVGPGSSVYAYNEWFYRNSTGGERYVEFDPGSKVVKWVSCSHPQGELGACGDFLGINLADEDFTLIERLGNPTEERIIGTAKYMLYADLGVEFMLKTGRIYGIRYIPFQRRPKGAFWRALRWSFRG